MKKRISIALIFALLLTLLAGCAGTPVVYYTECTCPPGGHTTTGGSSAGSSDTGSTPSASGSRVPV